jgi:uncharacterized protein YdiU (UPF0061 family)
MAATTGTSLGGLLATQTNPLLKAGLEADPKNDEQYPNQESREVFGQYVEVEPIPLTDPFLVVASDSMASEAGLAAAETQKPEFARLFSGDVAAAGGLATRPWATPYAVSVYGNPIPAPDPFGRGNGYGDGRALALGEFTNVETGARWELQLKGSGTTPFSRGGDGRAVLRSSVREFLASEAMHAMGVPTTRALSLVASGSQYTRRMWYKKEDRRRDHAPDTMVAERCAITCRAAPSFLRVGHLELWSRRAARGEEGAAAQLRALLRHAVSREFPEVSWDAAPAGAAAGAAEQRAERDALLGLARAFAERQAEMTCGWLRVGYVQGNMNSDNMLLSGRTMDYGPFGFMEKYSPDWSPFTSDAERKFGFERQPEAAQVNLMTLARALLPLLERHEDYEASVTAMQAIVNEEYPRLLSERLGSMRRAKLGLATWDEEAQEALWQGLVPLLAQGAVDYTIFWRQLGKVTNAETAAAAAAAAATDDDADDDAAAGRSDAAASALLSHLSPAFYDEAAASSLAKRWKAWLLRYAARLAREGRAEEERRAEMWSVSPKYVPREWIMADAYTKAEEGDLSGVQQLAALFAAPFDEQPQHEARFYRRTPAEDAGRAGIAYFS